MSLFIITSVIRNAIVSAFDAETRVHETLRTIQSIAEHAKGSHIIICEGSDYVWKEMNGVHVTYCNVYGMNKNVGEASLIHHVLTSDVFKKITEEHTIQRVFKISGRYYLTDTFDIMQHMHDETKEKIVIRRNPSHEPGYFCTVTVLYSFPVTRNAYVMQRLQRIIQNPGLPQNIEHEIFGYTDVDYTIFHVIPELGVSGHIAPCGTFWSS